MTEEERLKEIEESRAAFAASLTEVEEVADPKTPEDFIRNAIVQRVKRNYGKLFDEDRGLSIQERRKLLGAHAFVLDEGQLEPNNVYITAQANEYIGRYREATVTDDKTKKTYTNIKDENLKKELDKKRVAAVKGAVDYIVDTVTKFAQKSLYKGNLEDGSREAIDKIINGVEGTSKKFSDYCPVANLSEENLLKIYNGEKVDGIDDETSKLITDLINNKVSETEYKERLSNLYKSTFENYVAAEVDNNPALSDEEKSQRKVDLILIMTDGDKKYSNEFVVPTKETLNASAEAWIQEQVENYKSAHKAHGDTRTDAELTSEAFFEIFNGVTLPNGQPCLDKDGKPLSETVKRKYEELKATTPDKSEMDLRTEAAMFVAQGLVLDFAMAEQDMQNKAVLAGDYTMKMGDINDFVKRRLESTKLKNDIFATINLHNRLESQAYDKAFDTLMRGGMKNIMSRGINTRMEALNYVRHDLVAHLAGTTKSLEITQAELIEKVLANEDVQTALRARGIDPASYKINVNDKDINMLLQDAPECVSALQDLNDKVTQNNFIKIFGEEAEAELRQRAAAAGIDPYSSENINNFVDNFIENKKRDYAEQNAIIIASEALKQRGLTPDNEGYVEELKREAEQVYGYISDHTYNATGFRLIRDLTGEERIKKENKMQGNAKYFGLLPCDITEEKLRTLGVIPEIEGTKETTEKVTPTGGGGGPTDLTGVKVVDETDKDPTTPIVTETPDPAAPKVVALKERIDEVLNKWETEEIQPLLKKHEKAIAKNKITAKIMSDFDKATNKPEYEESIVKEILKEPIDDTKKQAMVKWFDTHFNSKKSLSEARGIIERRESGKGEPVSDEDYSQAIVVQSINELIEQRNKTLPRDKKLTIENLTPEQKVELFRENQARVSAKKVLAAKRAELVEGNGIVVTPKKSKKDKTSSLGASLSYSSIEAQLELYDLAISAMEKVNPVFTAAPASDRVPAAGRAHDEAREDVREEATSKEDRKVPSGIHAMAVEALWKDVSGALSELPDSYKTYVGKKSIAFVALASGTSLEDIVKAPEKYGYESADQIIDDMVRENFDSQRALFIREEIEGGRLKPKNGVKFEANEIDDYAKEHFGTLEMIDEEGNPSKTGRLRVQKYKKVEADGKVVWTRDAVGDVFPQGDTPDKNDENTHSNLTPQGAARMTVYRMLLGRYNVSDPKLSDNSVVDEARRNKHLYNAFVRAGITFDLNKYLDAVNEKVSKEGLIGLGVDATSADITDTPAVNVLDQDGNQILDKDGNPVTAIERTIGDVKVYIDEKGNVVDYSAPQGNEKRNNIVDSVVASGAGRVNAGESATELRTNAVTEVERSMF